MKVQSLTGDTYEGVQLNYYPDGSIHIGWHAEDERDLVLIWIAGKRAGI